jgi:hypothetical protein
MGRDPSTEKKARRGNKNPGRGRGSSLRHLPSVFAREDPEQLQQTHEEIVDRHVDGQVAMM